MKIINGAGRLPFLEGPLFLALGNFDGVHRGHQAILGSAVNRARETGGQSAALIFDPHPVIALRPEQPLCLLTDLADRAEIMADLGLDYLVVEPFTEKIATLTAEQFALEVLKRGFGVSGVFVGADYSFGRRGAGTAETLYYWGTKLGFEVNVAPMLRQEGHEVSSSRIRALLLAGAVREAAGLLNYFFFRQGRVVRGYGTGNRNVYPTANISSRPRLLWPGAGVYLTAVGNLDDSMRYGLTNIGPRPTFSRFDTTVETHILDFTGSIYNRDIRLCFLEKIRPVRTFASPSRLKEQVGRDIEQGRELISRFSQEMNGSGRSLQAGCSVLRSL